jgi:hypothetical protein
MHSIQNDMLPKRHDPSDESQSQLCKNAGVCSTIGRGNSLNRAFPSIALTLFGVPAAMVQQPATTAPQASPGLSACTQAMIAGTWQTVFAQFAVNPLQGNLGFACPIGIAANRTLTPGECVLSASQSILSPPSGTLTIDGGCRVIGTISFMIKNAMSVILPVQLAVSVWRSAVTVNLTCGSAPCVNNYVFPFEFVGSR